MRNRKKIKLLSRMQNLIPINVVDIKRLLELINLKNIGQKVTTMTDFCGWWREKNARGQRETSENQ